MRRRWLPLPLLLLWAALVALTGYAPAQEGWWLVGTSGLSGLLAQLTRSDGSLLRRQIHTRLLLLEPEAPPLQWRSWHLPVESPPAQGFASPVSRLSPVEDRPARTPRWELRVEGDGFQARAQVSAAPGCPGQVGDLEGYVRHDQDVRSLHGTGVLTRVSQKGRHRSRALYLASRSRALVIDPAADCPAWGQTGDQGWILPDIGPLPEGDQFTLSLPPTPGAPAEIRVRSGRPTLLDSGDRLLPPERWIAWLAGYPLPWQTVQRAIGYLDGEATPGLLITRGYGAAPEIPTAGPAIWMGAG